MASSGGFVHKFYFNSMNIKNGFLFPEKKKKSLPFKLLFLTVITYPKRLIVKVKKIKTCPHQKIKPESGQPLKIFPLIDKSPTTTTTTTTTASQKAA